MPTMSLSNDTTPTRGPQRPPVDDNSVFEAVVIKIEERENETFNTTELNFTFEVTSGEHKGRYFFGSVRPTFNRSSDCRLRQWTESILGQDVLPNDFVLDTDELVGLPCKVIVAQRVSKSTGRIYNSVSDVRPTNRVFASTPVNQEEDPF